MAHACHPDTEEADMSESLLGCMSEFEEGQGNTVKPHRN